MKEYVEAMRDFSPNHDVDVKQIGERIRGLIGGQDSGRLSATAERLGVSELSLRMSIDGDSPQPTIEVLLAIVRVYGVDPTWLLTGQYDAVTHRQAVAADRRKVANVIRELAARGRTSDDGPAIRLMGDTGDEDMRRA